MAQGTNENQGQEQDRPRLLVPLHSSLSPAAKLHPDRWPQTQRQKKCLKGVVFDSSRKYGDPAAKRNGGSGEDVCASKGPTESHRFHASWQCLPPVLRWFHVLGLQVGGDTVHIIPAVDRAQPPQCSGYGRNNVAIHELLPTPDPRPADGGRGEAVHVQFTVRRVVCPGCGRRMEAVSWLDRHSRLI